MICVVRALGAWGWGGLVGLGGCLDCCSPVAKCPKDGVGNGRIMGFGEMGCDLCGASVGRGDGGVGWTGGIIGLEGCLNWDIWDEGMGTGRL